MNGHSNTRNMELQSLPSNSSTGGNRSIRSIKTVTSSSGGGDGDYRFGSSGIDDSLVEDLETLGAGGAGGGSMTTGTFRSFGDGDVGSPVAYGRRGGGDPACVDPVVAEKEQRAVVWSRVVVIIVMVAASSIVAASMYTVVSRSERDDYETQFLNYASEIISVAQQNAKNTITTVEAFSATISSYASATESIWPYVTVQDFPERADRLAELTNAKSVTIAPIVLPEQRGAWFGYSSRQRPDMYRAAIEYEELATNTSSDQNITVNKVLKESSPFIFGVNISNDFEYYVEDKDEPSLVAWQVSPLLGLGRAVTNLNLLNLPRLNATYQSSFTSHLPALDFVRVPVSNGDIRYGEATWIMESQLMQPIFERVATTKSKNRLHEQTPNKTMVGVIYLSLDWVSYFENLLPQDVNGISLVLSSTCGKDVFTYRIDGGVAKPQGPGDLHEEGYDDMGISAPFVTFDYDNTKLPTTDTCIAELVLRLYPSREFEESFYTTSATYYTTGILAIFAFASAVFSVYDISVRRRQAKVMARIVRQDRIVSDLFPTQIRDRLYGTDDDNDDNNNKNNNEKRGGKSSKRGGMGEVAVGGSKSNEGQGEKPLADLFPNVTLCFADISGFTAWSSTREPYQVFSLLENIYSAFDKIAYRTGVFKIETVGDCYVACAGLPEERDDHALMVARFARDCLHKMGELTRKLEVTLGPDTADLELRVGLHSGQVTAGVLRGERSRFQLFGDTVNTAARMESTGLKNRIQISSATAEELKKFKKGKWIRPRDRRIAVKGKGEMQTYWLETKAESLQRTKLARMQQVNVEMAPVLEDASSELDLELDEEDFNDDGSDDGHNSTTTKTQRLVLWNVEVMSKLLRQILAARGDAPPTKDDLIAVRKVEDELKGVKRDGASSTTTVLEEFQEIITMPINRAEDLQQRKDPNGIVLPTSVLDQLQDFLTHVAASYQDNAFHNFEHASHVTASVRKLLTRIVKSSDRTAPCSLMVGDRKANQEEIDLVDLAGHSYGITSDPLTQFAVVFSAIIHDADHPGVPNAVLLQENTPQAQLYKKSIAEQNSVDIVWALLMKPEYVDLRACIYSNEEELRRFRQLVVNTVMATDIVDKELGALRKKRWETAFSKTTIHSTPALDVNRKATIVIEHLIQASDVSHTMQHWHVYKQWNERFFFECYNAYMDGRAETDPSDGWYKGEIGFFDFYIIPLAKKLESCGVFGVSSHEYLNYAMANRSEWEREGEKIVEEYLAKFELLQETVVEA